MPLPKTKDPMIVELARICASDLAMPTSFIEASNLKEANLLIESNNLTFPVLVYLSNKGNKNDIEESNEHTRKAQVQLLLLNQATGSTSDYRAADVNDLMYQMYQLGQNLQYWINKSTLSVAGGVDRWENNNLFDQFDAALFGHRIEMEWIISTGTTGYYNNPGPT